MSAETKIAASLPFSTASASTTTGLYSASDTRR